MVDPYEKFWDVLVKITYRHQSPLTKKKKKRSLIKINKLTEG